MNDNNDNDDNADVVWNADAVVASVMASNSSCAAAKRRVLPTIIIKDEGERAARTSIFAGLMRHFLFSDFSCLVLLLSLIIPRFIVFLEYYLFVIAGKHVVIIP